MRPQHQKVLLWTCSWRASLLTASESPGRSVTYFTLPSLLCFMAESTQLLLKVWLLPSLAPKSRSHKRGPSQLHHQLQGVRPHRQTVPTVAPPEHQRHAGGGERRSEQPQALHQIWCAGPGKDERRSGTCFHGAALLHPGSGWVSRIQLKDQLHFTSYKVVFFFPLGSKFTQLPLLLPRGPTEPHIPTTWKQRQPQHLWLLPQCGETATRPQGWPRVRRHAPISWFLRDKISFFLLNLNFVYSIVQWCQNPQWLS